MGSRLEAAKRGELYYDTGKPCKHGHVSRRYTKSGVCVACNRIKSAEESRKIRAILEAASEREGSDD